MPVIPYTPEVFPHRWLPAVLELKTWDQIEPWYKKLLDRPIESTADLEAWLFDVGELNGVVGQEGAKRHVAYTCQTDEPEREAAYLAFVRDIEPNLKPLLNAIRERYLDSPLPRRASRKSDTTFTTAHRKTAGNFIVRRISLVKPSKMSSASNIRKSSAR